MAGDDLLDQSCAGSGQTDNQQRRLVPLPEGGVRGEEPCCKAPHQPIDIGLERLSVELNVPAPDPVCRIEMPHRLRVVAQIIEQLADREMKEQAFLFAERGIGEHREHPPQAGTVGFAAPSRLDRPKVGRCPARVQVECVVKGLARLSKTSLASENIAERFYQRVALRIVRQSLSQLVLCSRKIRLQHQRLCEVQPGRFGIGSGCRGAAKALCRLLIFVG